MAAQNTLDLLQHIDPSALTYQEWINVGMALKFEGCSCGDWDAWSQADPGRYHAGECEKHWRTFDGDSDPVTGGTIFHYARQQGWQPSGGGHALSWDDTISDDTPREVMDKLFAKEVEVIPGPPARWHPAEQVKEYLSLLFQPEEYVGAVFDSYYVEERDKFTPGSAGIYNRTAGELIDLLNRYGDDLGWTFADYDHLAGAWIRFNPLDGNGVEDRNVSSYRYALVESDDMSLEEQYSLIQTLELPVKVLVHSGGKSLHAIVHIGAKSATEYKEKVKYLYEVLAANGMKVDENNKNPSRLSRIPGVDRGDNRQYIVAREIGKANFTEWTEFIEDLNDELPDIQTDEEMFKDPPPLAPELIHGVLRKGHKMLLSGPSKAGKSFALIELAIAIATGDTWFWWRCERGRVLYVNLEVDTASFYHRVRKVCEQHGIIGPVPGFEIWNLRGAALTLDKLVPKLIRRAKTKNYTAIIIDPIYKVITGDENNASEMAAFCNQFDKLCRSLGCSVIYCHHHSKGAQGGKVAMDRASGSGVFARDPDALVDFLQMKVPDYNNAPKGATGWKISCTLREFASPEPGYAWFVWPVHVLDETEELKRAEPDNDGYQMTKSQIKENRLLNFDFVYDKAVEETGNRVTLAYMVEHLRPDNDGNLMSESALRKYIKYGDLSDRYDIKNGLINRKEG